jgi:hypothetical protein
VSRNTRITRSAFNSQSLQNQSSSINPNEAAQQSSCIDPSIITGLLNHQRDADDSKATSSSDEEDDSGIDFYNRNKQPKQKVCPFSDSSRSNPCISHSQPRARKDAIMHHLSRIKSAGGDSCHPLNDSLWNSWIVRWYLQPRPSRFNTQERRTAVKHAQSKYYKKRKQIQAGNAESMKQKLENGEIDDEEYKKYLIGAKRREFITEMKLRASIEQRLQAESERKLGEQIEEKLKELRAREQSNLNPINVATTTTAIAALEAARHELTNTQNSVNAYKNVLCSHASNVVQFYSDENFLAAESTLLQYHGFVWPTRVSDFSFYAFAVLLVAQSEWNKNIRSDSMIRHMHKELREHIQTEQQSVEESDFMILDQVIATFNGCCDIIKQEEEQTESMSLEGRQHWIEEQDRMWKEAKEGFLMRFQFNSRPMIQLIRLIDDFADTYRAHKNAENDNQAARENAKKTADNV